MNDNIPTGPSPTWPESPPGESEDLLVLRAEIRASYEETWRLMRVLHEDVIARITALANGLQP